MSTTSKCRVCFCHLNANAIIHYDMRKLPKLAHKFVTCTDLSVDDEPRLPSELCRSCHSELQHLYAFRAKCIAADTKWRMEILAFFDEDEPIKGTAVEAEEPTEKNTKLDCDIQQISSTDDESEPAEVVSKQSSNPKNIYKCDICESQFLEQHRLQAHKRQHGLMPYPCPEPGCDRGYSHKNTLSIHMRKCHNLGKEHKSHVCEFCGKTFDTLWRLKSHRFTHKDKSELPFVCEPIKGTAVEAEEPTEKNSKLDCDIQLIRDTDDESEPAELVSKQSSNPKNIYKCDICESQFLEQHRLQAHKRQHGLMPYPCPEPGCDRGYSHKNTLSIHMRKCHNLGKEHKSHVCEFCGKTFDTLWRLKSHRFTHKDKSELPFVCEDASCGQRFSSKQLLKVHTMRHAGIKNYSCTFCGVQKTTRTELKIHMNYHTLERTYCCRLCSKVCNSSSNLNLHIRSVHERDRSRMFSCSYCDKAFTQPLLRKQHELIHTGEKPHECTDCGRHFRQKGALRTHRKIHERANNDTISSSTTSPFAQNETEIGGVVSSVSENGFE